MLHKKLVKSLGSQNYLPTIKILLFLIEKRVSKIICLDPMFSICTHIVDSGPQQKTPLGKTLILFPWRYLSEINIWLHIVGTLTQLQLLYSLSGGLWAAICRHHQQSGKQVSLLCYEVGCNKRKDLKCGHKIKCLRAVAHAKLTHSSRSPTTRSRRLISKEEM